MPSLVHRFTNWLAGEQPKEEKTFEPSGTIVDSSLANKRFYAEELLKNPIFTYVIETLIDEYTTLWRESDHEKAEMREQYYRYLRAVNQIHARFKHIVIEAVA